MKNQLVTALARLASRPYFERYIINAAIDSYVVPEELLEDVYSSVYWAKRAENLTEFSDAQMHAMDELIGFMDGHSDEVLFPSDEDAADKMLNGAIWTELRSKASAALVEFGRPLDTISFEEIDEGKIAGYELRMPGAGHR